MRKIVFILTVFLVLLSVIVLAKNIIAKTVIIKGVNAITGLQLRIKDMDVGILKPVLVINNLEILNPENFDDKIMMHFPLIYADYDLKGFLSGKGRLRDLKIELNELFVIINKKNEVNIKSLTAFLPKKSEKKQAQIQIDRLNLKIGKVVYKDYILGNPNIREFNINIDENFNNITDPKALVELILVRSLSRTPLPKVADVDLSVLQQGLSEKVKSVQESARQKLQEKAREGLGNVDKSIQDILKGTE